MKTFTVAFLVWFNFFVIGNAHGQARGGAFAAVPAPGQAVPPPVAQPQPGAAGQPTTPARPAGQAQPAQQQQQQQEQLRIVADPATNSLIVYGTAQEFQNIKNILKDLDVIPRQVLIEALVLQINLTDSDRLGFDYEIFRNQPDVKIFNREFGSRGALLSSGLAAATTATPTPFLGGLSGVIGAGNAVRAFVNALMTDSRVRVLSSPSVLATDNRPARIQVGTEEPVPTGTINAATGGTGVSSSTTVQYRNTGRILTIIPQVNAQGLVHLQVKAEVSARGGNVSFGGGTSADTATTFPTFDTQDAETTAVIQDGETLVIGGLIGERKQKDRTGIPYLMNIPVIGRFFSSESENNTRTELIMLITPRVIRNREESQTVTAEFRAKLGTVRNELERMERDREKLLPKPRPLDLPPMPDPNRYYQDEAPKPAPSSVVPGSGAMGPSSTGAADRAGNFQLPDRNNEVAPPKPQGFALSLVPARVETPVPSVDKPDVRAHSAKTNRVWAVQVAALAENKDAESLAEKLRREGHQAYVLTNQVGDKTWHRVRVGRFVDQQDAQELKKTLAASTQYRQAYVAFN